MACDNDQLCTNEVCCSVEGGHRMLLLCMQLVLGNESYYKFKCFKNLEILLKACKF